MGRGDSGHGQMPDLAERSAATQSTVLYRQTAGHLFENVTAFGLRASTPTDVVLRRLRRRTGTPSGWAISEAIEESALRASKLTQTIARGFHQLQGYPAQDPTFTYEEVEFGDAFAGDDDLAWFENGRSVLMRFVDEAREAAERLGHRLLPYLDDPEQREVARWVETQLFLYRDAIDSLNSALCLIEDTDVK
jgi:hypothetical protein